MSFENQKKVFLNKDDKSKKGGIDDRILPLVTLINSKEEYYTTSSCSGRILVFSFGERKNECKWLFVSHDKVDKKSNLLNNIDLNNQTSETYFGMQGAIIHVCCKDLGCAKTLLDLGKSAGFKIGGIISIEPKIIVELRSVDFLETIIAKGEKLLIDENYIQVLIKEANSKLERTWKRVSKLSDEIEKI